MIANGDKLTFGNIFFSCAFYGTEEGNDDAKEEAGEMLGEHDQFTAFS